MFCSKCGKEIGEGQRFCVNCGATVDGAAGPQGNPAMPAQQPVNGMIMPQAPQKKKGHGKVIVASILVVLAIALGVAGAILFSANSKKKADQEKYTNCVAKIKEDNVAACVDEMEEAVKGWESLGLFDAEERQAVLQKLDEISGDSDAGLKEIKKAGDAFAEAEKNVKQYRLEESEEYTAYVKAIENGKKAVENRDTEKIKKCQKEIDKALEQLISANEKAVNEKLAAYQNMNTTTAEKTDLDVYDEALQAVRKCMEENRYADISEQMEQIETVYQKYVEPENDLYMIVQQVDVLNYPRVKLYLNVTDWNGNVVENLDGGMFYIRKKDLDGSYVKETVTRAMQLNEKEALNIDMVADVSGSMWGDYLYTAQNIMAEFIDSVQFTAGDMVELTSFSDGVYIEQPFTNNGTVLKNSVYSLYTQNMTSLYDALYTAVNKVAARGGAKCVIAFTDGLDNYSKCTPSDVIDLAKRYHVPIFIIGIGYDDFSVARNIAESSGGKFYSVSAISDMSSIYDEIYRQEKKLYMIEFEDSTSVNIFSESNLVAGYHTAQYGGETNYSYTPYTLSSVDSDWIYQDGPEAVVAAYMKNFANAMTYMDYSYIAPYLASGSPIEQEQQKYVLKGISEVLDSYEIENVEYEGNNKCVVTTRETYFVQKQDAPLSLLTQRCQYVVEKTGSGWMITSFADKVQVLTKIKYD